MRERVKNVCWITWSPAYIFSMCQEQIIVQNSREVLSRTLCRHATNTGSSWLHFFSLISKFPWIDWIVCHVRWDEITTCSLQEEDSNQTVVAATLSAETLPSAKVETPGDAKPKPTPPPSPLLSSLLQNNQALLEALQKQQQVKVIENRKSFRCLLFSLGGVF